MINDLEVLSKRHIFRQKHRQFSQHKLHNKCCVPQMPVCQERQQLSHYRSTLHYRSLLDGINNSAADHTHLSRVRHTPTVTVRWNTGEERAEIYMLTNSITCKQKV